MENLENIVIQKGLSNRQAQILVLVTKGFSNREIAKQLIITEQAVKFNITLIYKKMFVKSRAQLIVWCLQNLGSFNKERTV